MSLTKKTKSSDWAKVIWPISMHENKKFIPMAMMMFCILLNYSTLRSIKDGLVVTDIGAEAISFLKTYVVLPVSVTGVILYAKLCNMMSAEKVFYTVTGFFLGYLVLFTFFLYPYHTSLHPNVENIALLSDAYPNLKWFIRIGGKWIFATFYTVSELWGAFMVSLLFWQFANQITKTEEAKRFYSMFGLLGNASLPLTALILGYFLHEETQIVSKELKFIPVLLIMMLSCLLIMLLYRWITYNVLTDPTLYTPRESGGSKKQKIKLSVAESLKMIVTSKYLGLIALLILSYGISINIVEGVWKSKIRELYSTAESYTMFMGRFQAWQGTVAIAFMLVGSNILRKVSWSAAAIFTPLMIFITGCTFFGFVFFQENQTVNYLTLAMGLTPLGLAAGIGTVQNVLSKATKYSLFDSTKEMAYIPLDDEMKSKGKAAVDVIGGRFGKSGGGVIQSTLFMLFPALTFSEAIPVLASVFFVIVISWLYSVKNLGKEYNARIALSASQTDSQQSKAA